VRRVRDAQNRPPCASMSDRQMESSIPMPLGFVVNSDSKMRLVTLELGPRQDHEVQRDLAVRSMRIAGPSSIALLPARRRNVTVSLICALEPVARREEMPDPRWSAGCKSPNALALPSRSAQPNDASIYVQNLLSPSVVLRPLKAPADDADLAQALHAEPVTVVRLLDEDHF
jgi:hypothetical protein